MKDPNILMIVLDATRHDVCSCYGHPSSTTPSLDQLAAEGMLYEQAISPAPWTLPAIASITTGLYPSQTDIYLQRRLDERFPTIAELLRKQGYATFCITNNDWLSQGFGLQRGFDTVYKLWQYWQADEDLTSLSIIEEDDDDNSITSAFIGRALKGDVIKNVTNAVHYKYFRNRSDYGARRTTKPLTNWIKQQDQPWFAFVHYLESHLQYRPPTRFARQFAQDWPTAKKLLKSDQWRLCWRHNAGVELLPPDVLQSWYDLYTAEVAYADYHMGRLIAWLRENQYLDNTLVIVTADHGEQLGDHGLLNHSYSLYESLIHVPLVLRFPPLFKAGERTDRQVQTIDLFATILEIAGGQLPVRTASQSLLSSKFGREEALAEYGMPVPPHREAMARYGLNPEDIAHRQSGLAALRTDSHKFILSTDGSQQLYDLTQDPDEKVDLSSADPHRLQLMHQALNRFWTDHEIDGLIGLPLDHQPVDSAVEERLQALGYLE